MSEREDPWKELIESGYMSRGRYVGVVEGLRSGFDLARHHCGARNQAVAFVLAHLRMMQISELFNTAGTTAQHFLISGAIYQMELPSRSAIPVPKQVEDLMAQFGLSELQKSKVRDKCFTTQDAHVLPCQLLINGAAFPDQLNFGNSPPLPKMAFAHLRGQFGRVDRMPTIFNETDSHAERLGFRDAFVEACLRIANAPVTARDSLDYTAVEQAYDHYVECAAGAADGGADRQRALAEKGSGDFAERFYRVAKAELFELYSKFTRAERPDVLSMQGMRNFVAAWGAD